VIRNHVNVTCFYWACAGNEYKKV